MINLQITIDLATIDINQLDAKLSTILAAAQELAEIGALSAATAPREEILPADPSTPKGAPAPIYGMTWPEFDTLVRSEMQRLGVDGRMPTTANWNNSRDVRLPTMAQILEAYDVLNLLTLAAKLELKPPHTALVREPFVVANGEVTQ